MLSKQDLRITVQRRSFKYNPSKRWLKLGITTMIGGAELLALQTAQAATPSVTEPAPAPSTGVSTSAATQPTRQVTLQAPAVQSEVPVKGARTVVPTNPSAAEKPLAGATSQSDPTVSGSAAPQSAAVLKSASASSATTVVTRPTSAETPKQGATSESTTVRRPLTATRDSQATTTGAPQPRSLDNGREAPLEISYQGVSGRWDRSHNRLTLIGQGDGEGNSYTPGESQSLDAKMLKELHEVTTIEIIGQASFDNYRYLFSDFANLTNITGSENIQLGQYYGGYSLEGMFANDPKLTTLDLSSLDVSNVYDTSKMFAGDRALRSLKLNCAKLSHLRSADQMFDQVGMDLDSSDQSDIDVSLMFGTVDTWDAPQLQPSWKGMFEQAKLKNVRLDATVITADHVTDLFKQAEIATLVVHGLVLDADILTGGAFTGHPAPFQDTRVKNLHLDNWELHGSKAHIVDFFDQIHVQNLYLPAWNLTNMTTENVQELLAAIVRTHAETIDLHGWSTVQDFAFDRLFANLQAKSLNLDDWLTFDVNSAKGMFQNARIDQLSMNDWGFAGIHLENMFAGAQIKHLSMVRANMIGADVANMFSGGTFEGATLSQWFFSPADSFDDEVGEDQPEATEGSQSQNEQSDHDEQEEQWQSQTDPQTLADLFADATFNGSLDLNSWRMKPVVSLARMFKGTQGLGELKINQWDVSNVTDFEEMFDQSTLTTIDTSSWHVQGKVNSRDMFADSAVKSLDLRSWDLRNAVDTRGMLLAPHLSKLTVGRRFKLTGATGPADAYISTPPTDRPYVGRWADTATNTGYTPAALAARYAQGGPAATYEWQKDGSSLKAQDVTLHQGQPFHVEQAVLQLTDVDGQPVAVNTAAGLSYTGNVNVEAPGRYPIMVTYQTGPERTWSQAVTVTVLARQSLASLSGRDLTLVAGPKRTWHDLTGLLAGTDDAGHPLTLPDLAGTSTRTTPGLAMVVIDASGRPTKHVALDVAGHYQFQFRYLTSDGIWLVHTSDLQLATSRARISWTPVTLIQNHQAVPNLDADLQVTDAAGQLLADPLTHVRLVWAKGPIDPHVAGTYPVTAIYEDVAGNHVAAATNMVVLASRAVLKLTPARLIAGPLSTFDQTAYVQLALDEAGQPLAKDQLSYQTNVDPHRPGNYWLNVAYHGPFGTELSAAVPVTVVATKAQLVTITRQALTRGQHFDPRELVIRVLDATGKPVSSDQVQFGGIAQTDQVGQYGVTASYTDVVGNQFQRLVLVVVSDPAVTPGPAPVPDKPAPKVPTPEAPKPDRPTPDRPKPVSPIPGKPKPGSSQTETHDQVTEINGSRPQRGAFSIVRTGHSGWERSAQGPKMSDWGRIGTVKMVPTTQSVSQPVTNRHQGAVKPRKPEQSVLPRTSGRENPGLTMLGLVGVLVGMLTGWQQRRKF